MKNFITIVFAITTDSTPPSIHTLRPVISCLTRSKSAEVAKCFMCSSILAIRSPYERDLSSLTPLGDPFPEPSLNVLALLLGFLIITVIIHH